MRGILSTPLGAVVIETHWGTAGITTQKTEVLVCYMNYSSY